LIGQLGGKARGSAVALYGFFIFVGASFGPLLASFLMPYGFQVLGILLAVVLLLAAVIASMGVHMGPISEANS
jgi:YNFM family putative membrane transporter